MVSRCPREAPRRLHNAIAIATTIAIAIAIVIAAATSNNTLLMAILGVCAPFFWSPIPNSFSELGLGTKKKGAQTPKIDINKVLLDVGAAMTMAMAMAIVVAMATAL